MEEAAPRNQLEKIIETIAEGILVINRDGIIVYANESAEKILGVKRTDLIGRPYSDSGYSFETLEGAPFPLEERPIAKVLKTGTFVRNKEYAIIRPDGIRIILSANAVPLRDEAGTMIGAILSFADITIRKHAEEAAKESERIFRGMLQQIDLIALILDTQGNVAFANDYLLDLTGWRREEVIGKNWFDKFIPEENREEIKQVFHEVITRGVPAHYENDIITRERERRTIAFSNVTLRDREGNVTGTASVGDDITFQKQAAKEIRESRKQVLDILESITDGFFALDNDWRFTYVNHRATEFIGKRREELLFRNMWDAVPATVGTVFETEYRRAVEEKTPVAFEAFFPPSNKWFEVHAHPFENGLSAYFSDITERKRAEEALRESENRYRTLFEDSPVSLWEEDASSVKSYIDDLKGKGIKDFKNYFASHPEDVAKLAAMVKIVDVNKTTLELYKARSKEEFKKNLTTFFGEETFNFFKEAIIALAEGKTSFTAETVNRTLTGDVIDISIDLFVAPGYEGTLSKVIVAILDVTERKKAEEGLKESESRYRTLFEESPVALWVQDASEITIRINELKRQGVKDFRAYFERNPEAAAELLSTIKITDVNKTVLKLYGAASKEDFINNFPSTFTKEGLDSVREFLIALAERGEARFEAEFTSRTFKGEIIDVSVIAFVPPGYEKTRSKVFVATVDITERRRAEIALKESEERYRLLFENAPIALWEQDASGVKLRIEELKRQGVKDFRAYFERHPEAVGEIQSFIRVIDVNRATLKLFEASSKEDFLRNIWKIFTKDALDAVKELLISIGEAGEMQLELETTNRTFTGKIKHVLVSQIIPQVYEKTLSKIYIATVDITERKLAEIALRESENRYRTLFEDSPIAMWEQDDTAIKETADRLKQQGVKDFKTYYEQHPEVVADILAKVKFVDMNKAALRLFKASSKEEYTENLDKTFTDEGYATALKIIAERSEGKPLGEQETKARTLKGDTIYVVVNELIPPGYEETLSKVIVSITDITKRKKAEEALRSSQALLQSIIDNTTAVIYVKDIEGRYILINRQYEVLFHITREEIVGRTDYEIFPKERADAFRANDQKVLDTGEPLGFEEVAPIDAELRTYISIKFPLRDPKGDIYGVCGISTDITERKRAEEALKESEERFRKLFDEGPLGVAVVGLDYRFVKANAKLSQMLGYTEEELTKLKFTEITHPDDVEADITARQKLYRGELPLYSIEKRYIKKNREPLWASMTASIIRDEKGKPLYYLSMIEDIEYRKRAESELKRAKELTDALNDINSAITSTLDIDEIMQRVVVESAKAIGSETAVIFLREGDRWVTMYIYGFPQELAGLRLTDEEAQATTLAARTKRLVVVNDAFHDERVSREVMEKYNVRSFISVPLITRGDVIGVLFLSYNSAPVTFNEAQIDFAGKLAVAVSVAIENARLFEELTRSTDELGKRGKSLQTLLDVALDITSGLELNELMYKIARNAAELTGADIGGVGLVDEETGGITYPFLYNMPEITEEVRIPPGQGMSSLILSRKAPLIIEDYQKLPQKFPVFAAAGLHSIVMVPLWARGKVRGILVASHRTPGRQFNEEDIARLEGIGRHAAIALENARLYETERHIADTLQEALLIMPKRIEGIEFSYLYRSATEAAKVGGDFYDIFEMEHGKIGIVIGDVSGKGLEATTLTSVVKNTIKAHTYEDGLPASIMAKTNDLLVRTSPAFVFVTVFFGVLDKETGELTYCSAGHPPAMIKRKTNDVDLLSENSPVIGAFSRLDYRNAEETLKKGDTLILYTDGIIEARRDGELFGEEMLVNFIKHLRPTPIKEMPEEIFKYVMDYTGGKLLDDIALLSVSLGYD